MRRMMISLMVLLIAFWSMSSYGQEKIKIGVIGPMSGAGAVWGIGMQRGVTFATEDVNAAGGVKVGSKKYLLDFIAADDKYTGSAAVSEGARIIFENKVKYVVGPIGSSPTVAFSPMMNENKILVLCDSYTPRAVSPQFPYNFRALSSTSHEVAPVLWKYVKEKYNVKKVVLIGQNDETGKAETDHDRGACQELGIQVIHTELFDLATTDFMPLMTKVVGMNPDAIEIGSAAAGYVSQMAKALYELGYKGVRVSNSGSGEAEVMVPVIGKEACEGLVSANTSYEADYATPWMREFHKRYTTRFGKPFSMTAAWVYWPVMMLKEAMEKTGSLDTDRIKSYLETPNKKFMHIWGESQFGGKKYYGANRQFKVHVPLTEIRDGKNVLVQAPQIPPLELE
jgi:branched-chain amino acid transport system substrate-binding protein